MICLMSYEIISTPNFEKEIKQLSKKYHFLKNDMRIVITSLSDDPLQGSPIYKNCYKVRFTIKRKRKGKSGGGRLLTNVKVQENKIYLLSVYAGINQ